MQRPITRRHALAGLGSSLLLPLAPGISRASESAGVFRHGVASGDPDVDSLVIWTRVSGTAEPVVVDWEVAQDEAFTSIVSSGRVTTDGSRDHTVKVLVSGLQPGARYRYRFRSAGEVSPVGYTRTLPSGPVDTVGFAVVSCSNYPFGYFNVYESIARDPAVQWVLHLGDYLYEYGPDGYGAETGQMLGREHQPARETLTLADYRQRHAQYKGDPQSQRLHAAHPLLAIWDDHESANNPWVGGAENHQPANEGDWQQRREAALQAYFEWMPVRDPAPGLSRADYWRHWRFGDLASLVSLETRHSGRAEQIEYGDFQSSINDRASARRFLDEVVAAEGRPMLSPAMEVFVCDALRDSVVTGRPWRLIANQVPMARTHHPELPKDRVQALAATLPESAAQRLRELARMGELDLPLYLDPWDGYPRARENFYRRCREEGVRDLLVLTGDSHSFWLNQLFDDQSRPMGLELGTTGVTSPGDFVDLGDEGARLMDAQLAAANREVLWTEGRTHGYLRLQLNRDSATAEYVGVDTIATTDYRDLLLKRVNIRPEGGTLVVEA